MSEGRGRDFEREGLAELLFARHKYFDVSLSLPLTPIIMNDTPAG